MRTYCGRLLQGLVITSVFAWFVGCSSMSAALSRDKQEPPDLAARAEAQTVLSILNGRNAGLKSFKGIGNIKIWQAGRLKIDERIAWVGAAPGKINIAVLIGGYPAVKMASDGKWFYYYEAGQGEPIYKKYAVSNASLKRFLSIAVQTDDVLTLLAGRVPIRAHQTAILTEQAAQPGYVLVLKKRWWGVIEKIFLDESKTQARQVEFYSRSGSLIYRARFDEMQMISDYRVPGRLHITDGQEAAFELDVDRYQVDVEVNPSVFVLKPPN